MKKKILIFITLLFILFLVSCGETETHTHTYGIPVTIEATCETDGSNTYICSGCGEKKVETIPALGHKYNTPTYTWSEIDGDWYCTAEAICKNDSKHVLKEIIMGDLIEENKGTCSEKPYNKYEAVFENEEFTTQYKVLETGDLQDHEYGTVTYEWVETTDGYNCVATVTCNICQKELTETAVGKKVKTNTEDCINPAEYKYTANFASEEFKTQTKTVKTSEYGSHSFSTPTYEWSLVGEDYYCEAIKECSKSSSHNVTEKVQATVKVITEATYSSTGLVRYTVEFTDSDFETQTKDVITPKTEAKYTYVEATSTMKEHYTLDGSSDYYIFDGEDYIKVPISYLTINPSHTCSVDLNPTYTLITNTSELTVGDKYLFIVKVGETYYILDEYNTETYQFDATEADVDINGNLTRENLYNAFTLESYAKTSSGVSGKFGIGFLTEDEIDYYLSSKGSTNNTCKLVESCTQNAQSWSITFNDGVATIVAAGTNKSKYFRFYNSSEDKHFACFTSNDNENTLSVSIYKVTESKDFVKGTEATCSSYGTIDHFECSCGKCYDFDGEELYDITTEKLDHEPTLITEYDYSYYICENCGAVIESDGNIVKAFIVNSIKLPDIFDEDFSSIMYECIDLYNMLTNTEKEDVKEYYNNLTSAIEVYNNYKALDLNSDEVKIQAIVNTGLSYTYKGTEIQYDQYTYRRNYNALVEDMNEYNYTYLDCSSYVSTVYNYALDIQSLPYNYVASTSTMNSYASRYYGDNVDIIYYENLKNRDSSLKTDEEAQKIWDMLQPGDYYCYRHGDAGHVMLYVGDIYGDGNKYFIHSTGSAGLSSSNARSTGPYTRTTEDQTTHEKKLGSLCIDKANIVFVASESTKSVGGSSDRYIFASSNTSISIIRPINRSCNISTNGLNKLMYRDLNIHKTTSVSPYSTILKGQEITFTISLKNESNTAIKYNYIDEAIPEGLTYVSSTNNGIYYNGHITWHISEIPANSTVTISYTLKNTLGSGCVSDDATYVNGVKLTTYSYSVGLSTILDGTNTFDGYISDQNANTSIVKYINYVYNILGYNIDSIIPSDGTNETLVTSLLNENEIISGSTLSSYIPNTLFGGYGIRGTYADLANCWLIYEYSSVRNVTESMLDPGDIILAYWNGHYDVFFYTGDKLLQANSTTGVVEEVSNISQTLHTLAYYASYAVVRLSMVLR